MAADMLEFTDQANMSFNPFLPANAPRVDPGFEVSSTNGSNRPQEIEVHDYMAFDEGTLEGLSPLIMAGNNGAGGLTSSVMKCEREVKRMKMDPGRRIGFRTKSVVEILDDGFKWRKYGKKSVKNSPNPRNYYRCSSEGCGVKKRVERDAEDPRYVITTYEGVHNHPSPDASCCGFGAHHQHHGCGNYYRRPSEGYGAERSVGRDGEDPRYVVITTYEGVGKHPSPGAICCGSGAHHQYRAEDSNWASFGRGQQVPVVAPNPWSAVQSANSSC